MRILVTGGAGFIGSCYVRAVLDGEYPGYEDAQVTVLDLLTYAGNRANLPAHHPRLTFVRGDVCDAGTLLELLPGHDAVVHFAAESHVDRSLTAPAEFVRTNVAGTQTLMEACLRSEVPRVLHVSTDEVYGSIEEGSWPEEWPLDPSSPYAATKAGSDLIAGSYWHSHGLDVSVSRCSNNYGPYQHVEKLIPLFATRLFAGRSVPLYGNGHNVREWIHVADHCRALQLILTKGRGGEIYNVGGGTPLTNLQVTERLLALCGGGQDRVRMTPDRKGHDQRYSVDGSKLREEVGFEPTIPFEQGLAETVAWYRDRPERWGAPDRSGQGRAE